MIKKLTGAKPSINRIQAEIKTLKQKIDKLPTRYSEEAKLLKDKLEFWQNAL